MRKGNIKTLLKSMRLPFLTLTFSSIFLSYSAVYYNRSSFQVIDLLLIALGAVSAHISVNSFNEYYDFKSGLDALTEKTRFSGGSGALIINPNSSRNVLSSALVFLTITILVGLFFIIKNGPSILPFGLFGIIIIISYTNWLNRSPFFCLIAPGLAFGPIMIMGTYLVLTSSLSIHTFFLSLIPFFLVNNLLLLNQLPDIKADKTVGRRHFPIVYGIENSLKLYAINTMITGLIIIMLVSLKVLPALSLISILPLLASIKVFRGLHTHIEEIRTRQFANIEPLLGLNVGMTLVTPVLIGLTLLL
ncbi:1,4-dihydroxy-2-naphthoate octaprenyltransferase [Cocleimonas flava]|uniref:1,4-dihydroxy-2-naphthoate octaprenyltransferase n=2 Tax=Cocleimonas flava TaxID=634765 RepID=A0A4R1EYY5_9GAMM|nr:1,4-dihydroxy-2-naphthoate octaprenyltransferase [Cocleimonas flava]